MLKKGLAVGIILLFLGTAITALGEPSDAILTQTNAVIGFHETSRDQIELHYYDPYTLSSVIGVDAGAVWKEAIRLTHTELAPYSTWTLTKVVIGFNEDPNEGPMNVTIFIYDNGTSTYPGNLIVDDTWAVLNRTDLITVPLTTPVSLAGHTELWVAVQWTQKVDLTHYAFVDAGPAVIGKGDWIHLNNVWQEIHSSIDSNWALGAIVEGEHTPTPPTITGPATGQRGTTITYHFTTMDPAGYYVYFFIDWGDKTPSVWHGPYSSGKEINVSHTWNKRGTFTIKAKAKDTSDYESDWGTLQVHMPLSYEPPHLRFFDWLLERFQHVFPILRYFLDK
jgi:hypothetical protein